MKCTTSIKSTVRSSKSPRSRKNRIRAKYAYTLRDEGVMYTALGDPIIFEGPGRYVCGGCFLLLKSMDVRFWSRSPLPETLPTLPMQMTPYAHSKCGCELNILSRSHYLFPNSPHEEESTFMAYSLTCRCLSAIRAKVNGVFRMEMNEKIVPSLNSGERASWMRHKLMDLDAWHITSVSTSPKEEVKSSSTPWGCCGYHMAFRKRSSFEERWQKNWLAGMKKKSRSRNGRDRAYSWERLPRKHIRNHYENIYKFVYRIIWEYNSVNINYFYSHYQS